MEADDSFPMEGTWKLTCVEENGQAAFDYTGTIFKIEEANGNEFSGYFDWYTGSTYWGREHIRGTYNPDLRKLTFAGYQHSNIQTIYVNSTPYTLALDAYEAYLAEDSYDFATSNWGSGKGWAWQAKYQN
jgi:hypothetical protein